MQDNSAGCGRQRHWYCQPCDHRHYGSTNATEWHMVLNKKPRQRMASLVHRKHASPCRSYIRLPTFGRLHETTDGWLATPHSNGDDSVSLLSLENKRQKGSHRMQLWIQLCLGLLSNDHECSFVVHRHFLLCATTNLRLSTRVMNGNTYWRFITI